MCSSLVQISTKCMGNLKIFFKENIDCHVGIFMCRYKLITIGPVAKQTVVNIKLENM